MISIGLIDKLHHHIIIDGNHKMILNGDEVYLILLHQIEYEPRQYEDKDHVQFDGMFQVQKIGKQHVIRFFELLVQVLRLIIH